MSKANFKIDDILKWNRVHVCAMSVASVLSIWTGRMDFLGVAAILSFGGYILIFREQLRQYSLFGGLANLITWFRLGIVVSISFHSVDFNNPENDTLIVVLFLLCIFLDGVDGYVARKLHSESDFGLYLDMETDAFQVALMSLLLWRFFDLHWIIILAGLFRYLYVIALMLLGLGRRKEPRRNYASVIAGMFVISLLAGFISQHILVLSAVYFSCFMVTLSFARSFFFQISECS